VKQIAQVEKAYLRDDIPEFNAGDTVKVHVRIKKAIKSASRFSRGR